MGLSGKWPLGQESPQTLASLPCQIMRSPQSAFLPAICAVTHLLPSLSSGLLIYSNGLSDPGHSPVKVKCAQSTLTRSFPKKDVPRWYVLRDATEFSHAHPTKQFPLPAAGSLPRWMPPTSWVGISVGLHMPCACLIEFMSPVFRVPLSSLP